MTTLTVQGAFRHCEKIAKSHYENFPVGWFLPKELRPFVFAVYAFARTADDLADEEILGSQTEEGNRIEELERFEHGFDRALAGQGDGPVFIAAAETVHRKKIPPQLLKNLLRAFRQDIVKKRYADFKELADYCVYSANPIGRIVLHLFGHHDPELMALSDRICTGIQLVNHWQDVGVDLLKDRVYLPKEDLDRFGYTYDDLKHKKIDEAFQSLMRFEISRARSLFFEGQGLFKALKGRLRWQVALMWLGPLKILDRIEGVGYDVFRSRPALSKKDLMKLAFSIPRL